MTRYLIALVLFILIGYGLFEAWPLLAGPSLSVESPQNEQTFPDGIVPIKGKASRIALLTLNGIGVLHDKEGVFSGALTFPQGESILTFVATDRFGRHVTTTRSIFVSN
ncbi:MAG: hypothetical protein NTV60_02470 [Candidatus Kaiserbacteria bacterium]|nr:hypothetical protein [Candidatus Kaiserbacteria bacterium]